MGIVFAHGKSNQGSAPPFVRALIVGIPFGLFMGLYTRKRIAKVRYLVGPMSDERFGLALKFANKGPLPSDPELRRASASIIAYRLGQMRRARTANYLVFGGFVVLGSVFAVIGGPIWWLLVALFLAAFVLSYWQTERASSRALLFGLINAR